MPIPTPSPELSAEIQRQIDAMQPIDGVEWQLGEWPNRVCKEELGALPLWADLIFTWALRPDGTVLCMDRDSLFHPTEPETDPLVLFAVLEQAARMIPELRPLVPDAPTGTRACTRCGGHGHLEEGTGQAVQTVFCWGCNGLGWIIRP